MNLREDNHLATSDGAVVWLNIDPSVATRQYTYEIYSGGVLVDDGRLHFKQCSSPYQLWRYDFFDAPDVPATYTLVVYDRMDVRVSGDSSRSSETRRPAGPTTTGQYPTLISLDPSGIGQHRRQERELSSCL
jgi:hypothetical protein